MFLASTLQEEKAVMSIAGKIGIQISAKRGIAVWEVCKSHPYWNERRVAAASMSYSRSATRDFTLSFVGTTSNSQTSVYSYCITQIPRKETVASQILLNFYRTWLWQYRVITKTLPNTLIMYREGLSEAQLRKSVIVEVQCLQQIVFNEVHKWGEDCKGYSPEIVYLTVNKNIKSRFYDIKQSKNPNKPE